MCILTVKWNSDAEWVVSQGKAGRAACHPLRSGCLWLNRQGNKRCWNRGQIQEKQGKFGARMHTGHTDLILPTSQQLVLHFRKRGQVTNGVRLGGGEKPEGQFCQSLSIPWLLLTTVEDTGKPQTQQTIQQPPHTKATPPTFVFNPRESQVLAFSTKTKQQKVWPWTSVVLSCNYFKRDPSYSPAFVLSGGRWTYLLPVRSA